MDFGIARVSEMKAGTAAGASGLTTRGHGDGHARTTCPPEQAQGSPADFRSDIYSLAVVLYEVFTGRLPFTADTIMKVVLAHIRNPPPPPRTVNDRIPPELEAVILRGLEKEPAARYQTVEEMARDLDEVSRSRRRHRGLSGAPRSTGTRFVVLHHVALVVRDLHRDVDVERGARDVAADRVALDDGPHRQLAHGLDPVRPRLGLDVLGREMQLRQLDPEQRRRAR